MKMLLLFSLTFLCMQAQADQFSPRELPATLATLDAKCMAIQDSDYLICPTIKAFRYTGEGNELNKPEVIAKLLKNHFEKYADDLEITNAKTASNIISRRLIEQAALLYQAEDGTFTEQQLQDANDVATGIQTYVAGWQQMSFMIADDYWAPSVNSSTVVLANPESGLVIVIEHGDTDG